MCPMIRRPPGMELALLGFLQNGPQHGYQIHQLVSHPDGLGLIWNLKQSQLYALFDKLEAGGYVSSVMQSQEPYPPRRVFTLTGDGRKAYRNWLTSPVTVPRMVRQEFLAKLYFLREAEKDIATALIERQRAVCQQWLDDFKRQSEKGKPGSFRGRGHSDQDGPAGRRTCAATCTVNTSERESPPGSLAR